MFIFGVDHRLLILEEKIRDPKHIASVDCLLDTVTALVADCDHDSVKKLKNIEAYTQRCKWLSK
jgi:hypothetical protein